MMRYPKSDEEKAQTRREKTSKQNTLFLANLDPIWYFGAGIASIALAFRLFTTAAGDGPTNIMGVAILLLAMAAMFLGGFLYYNRAFLTNDEDEGVKHKVIPVALLALSLLAFIGGETNTASNLGAGSGLFAQKSGQTLEFKSLVEGANVTLTEGSETITIALSAAASSGTTSTFKEDGTPVGDADIVTADFGPGFDLTESPDTEINITFDPTEITLTDDNIWVGSATNLVAATTLVDCVDSGGNHLNYTAATNTFSCGTSSSGGGSGTLNTIKESGVQIGDADIAILDFGIGFDCTESPDTEINCVLDYTEDPIELASEVNGTLPAGNGGTGQTSATLNALLVGNGTSFDLSTLPSCSNTTTSKLLYNNSTQTFTCGTDQSSGTDPVDIEDNGVSEQVDASTINFSTNLDVSCAAGDCTITIADVFSFAAGDVYTGVHDFGGATSLEIPNGAGGTTVNAAGEITIDTTSDTLNYYDGTTERVLSPTRTFSFTLEDPTSAEDITLWYTNSAITIRQESCVVVGTTPSVTVTLRHGTDRSATGAEANTGGTTVTSTSSGDIDSTFDDGTVVADSFLWIETTAQSGTVSTLTCSWDFTQDA